MQVPTQNISFFCYKKKLTISSEFPDKTASNRTTRIRAKMLLTRETGRKIGDHLDFAHSRKHLYESQEGDNYEENSTGGRKKAARDLGLHLGCGGTAGVERGSRQPRWRRLRAKRPPEAEARAVGRGVRGRSHSSTTRRRSGGIFRRVRRRRRR